MDLYEQIVAAYVTRKPHVFASSQYSIRGDQGEWSCPDLVALDFNERKVIVAEVSTGWRTKALLEKVKNRDGQWIDKLKAQLLAENVIDASWRTFEVWIFVREHACASFEEAVKDGTTPVRVFCLDKLGAPWQWSSE